MSDQDEPPTPLIDTFRDFYTMAVMGAKHRAMLRAVDIHIIELTRELGIAQARLKRIRPERDEARRERDSLAGDVLVSVGRKAAHDSIRSFLEGYRGNQSMEEARKRVDG